MPVCPKCPILKSQMKWWQFAKKKEYSKPIEMKNIRDDNTWFCPRCKLEIML